MPGHVLHIITGLNSGGAERSLFNLVTSELDTGFTHSVASLADLGYYGPILRHHGVAVQAHDMRGPAALFSAATKLRTFIRETRPDVIQGWMPHGNMMATITAAMAGRRARLAWNVRQSLYDLQAEKPATRWIIKGLKALSARPGAIIYNSQQARQHHEALGFSSRHGVVIPNGFNTERWKPDEKLRTALRAEIGIANNVLVGGFVGRFHSLKDVPTFMSAAAMALEHNSQLHFVMVGEGLTRDNVALQSLFSSLPMERFHTLGPRADIEAVMPAFDFFCLSSVSEAFPNVVGEAMASGLPCIATDVGDCARLVDGHGRIVPRSEPEKMAEAMTELATMDVARRAEIGKAARSRIMTSYGLVATIDAYVQLYESMMKREV